MAFFEYLPFGVGKCRELSAKVLKIGGDPMNGTASTEITATGTEINTLASGTAAKKLSVTVARAAFTDGGGTSGTYTFASQIPVNATVVNAAVKAITGFTGDTSAVLTIGDGTDVDRYNTGTVNVFATAANGASCGDPSGVKYHDTAKAPVLTVTSATDFTLVTAGSVTVEIFYLP